MIKIKQNVLSVFPRKYKKILPWYSFPINSRKGKSLNSSLFYYTDVPMETKRKQRKMV